MSRPAHETPPGRAGRSGHRFKPPESPHFAGGMSIRGISAAKGAGPTRHVARVAAIETRWLTAGVVFVIAISLYGATLLRGVSSFDSAEMQTVPAVLGIAHPTGYPLWTLLGFLWTQLPIASPALLMNMLSAILFALASAALSLVALRLDVRPVLAAVAALSFSFAGETWSRATQVDVHSLHTLLMAALLLAWVIAEQTGDRRAALAMILITSVGLSHHRLMAIQGLPLLLWFFGRHLKTLRSRSFLVDAILCGLTPLVVYLYIPLRIHEHPPVVNADTSGGSLPIIRGDLFASHEHAFAKESFGHWWRTLPSYGDFAVRWLGWVVIVLALAGAVQLALRRWPVFVGLTLIVLTSTWGLANRTDLDYRWLIMPVFVLCLFAAVALEAAARFVSGSRIARAEVRVHLLVPALAVLIPLVAIAAHFSTFDRSADRRDALNGEKILSAVAPNAVIWSYWDVRTTLQYLTAVEHVRPDVEVLDHRAYANYRSLDDGTVALDIGMDPAFAGRPYYLIAPSDAERAAVAQHFALEPVVPIDLPYGFDYRGKGWLYLVHR